MIGGSGQDPPRNTVLRGTETSQMATETLPAPTRDNNLPVPRTELRELLAKYNPPPVILDAGQYATFGYVEFFSATIRNPNTTKAYRRAVDRFLAWCEDRGLEFREVSSAVIAEYLDEHLVKANGQPLANPSKKLHLAALKHFYDIQERRHGVPMNPATAVRGPGHKVAKGKTRPFQKGQVKKLLASIDTTTIVGLRDRAILAVLYWTACRAGACAKLRLRDYYPDGERWWFYFGEKGDKAHTVKANHTLQAYIKAYIEAADIGHQPTDWPLFRSAMKRKKGETHAPRLTPYQPPDRHTPSKARGVLTGNDILRIVKRRLKTAGLPPDTFTAHSFRSTTATNLRKKGIPRDQVQYLLGHADARTTALYDHSDDEQAQDIVDQITL